MSIIEGRWKAVILCNLYHKKKMRFNQLLRDIEGVSPRMLTKQLKELERDGLIAREAYHEIPPRVEYSLTQKGLSIVPVLSGLAQWGLANLFRSIVTIDAGTD
jgi:DNA-binding HxlR family transcriptional regulator